MGDSLLIKAISQSTGRDKRRLREDVKSLGDLGLCAERCRNKQSTIFKPKPLTVNRVLKDFRLIAQNTKADVGHHFHEGMGMEMEMEMGMMIKMKLGIRMGMVIVFFV